VGLDGRRRCHWLDGKELTMKGKDVYFTLLDIAYETFGNSEVCMPGRTRPDGSCTRVWPATAGPFVKTINQHLAPIIADTYMLALRKAGNVAGGDIIVRNFNRARNRYISAADRAMRNELWVPPYQLSELWVSIGSLADQIDVTHSNVGEESKFSVAVWSIKESAKQVAQALRDAGETFVARPARWLENILKWSVIGGGVYLAWTILERKKG
jgi:hypothetical protein